MDYMELQFPDDAREVSVRQGRNISDTERWVSMAGGVGLAAYGYYRVQRALLSRADLATAFPESAISPVFRANGSSTPERLRTIRVRSHRS